MAELAARERLQPSLLDRLTDDAPGQRRESADHQLLTTQKLRAAVLRDVAALLNTTDLATTTDLSGSPLAAASTINYGVAGFTGLIASAGRMQSIETAIAAAIRNFEPRIRPETLRVRLREMKEESPLPALIFEIEGELWAQPAPLRLFLETSIDLETRLTVVTDVKPRG
jgi:type VI secretion system protein ImpF